MPRTAIHLLLLLVPLAACTGATTDDDNVCGVVDESPGGFIEARLDNAGVVAAADFAAAEIAGTADPSYTLLCAQ
jgi:hypothetical protein